MKEKILNIEEARKIVQLNKEQKIVTVNVHGCFDLLHYGHVLYFENAKQNGNKLLVSVTPDRFVYKGPSRPFINELARLKYIASLEIVDYVVLNDSEDAVSFLKTVKPDITCRGKEYKDLDSDITGKISLEKAVVQSYGGQLIFIDTEVYSSTSIINSLEETYTPEQNAYRASLNKKVNKSSINSMFDKMANLKVLVIGEPIIDEYVYCNPLGTVSKHSAISALYNDKMIMLGGALAVSNNVASLVKSVDLCTIFGQKNIDFIKDQLAYSDFNLMQEVDKENYTPHKKRYIASGYPSSISRLLAENTVDTSNRLFEINYLTTNGWDKNAKDTLTKRLEKRIQDFDVVFIVDFGHELFDRKLIELICNKANYLALNVQTNSSNFGFNMIDKYPRADFICIDELESRLVYSDKNSSIETLAERLSFDLSCRKIMITRGSNGIYYKIGSTNHYAPALAKKVIDAVGAGDSVLSSAGVLSYLDKEGSTTILTGSISGMISTSIVCNSRSISRNELLKTTLGFL